jgi:hypothetical protein
MQMNIPAMIIPLKDPYSVHKRGTTVSANFWTLPSFLVVIEEDKHRRGCGSVKRQGLISPIYENMVV